MRQLLSRHQTAIRGASLVLLALSFPLLVRALPVAEGVEALRARVAGLGAWGLPAFGAVYVVAVVALVPCSLLTMAGAALFGVARATAVVSVAATLGATLAFLIARHLARARVERAARRRPRFRALDEAIAEGGFRTAALLRLSPLIPFNVSNYLFGLSGLGLGAFVLSTWLGMLPVTLLYALLGRAGGGALAGDDLSGARGALLGLGLLATAAATIALTVVAQRKLERATEAPPEPDAPSARAERSPARTAALGALAVGVAALSISCALQPRWLRSLLGGPPAVEGEEVHERRPDGPTVDHALLDGLLHAHVKSGGWVDYEGLAAESETLDRYLALLAAVDYEALGRDEKLALWIDAYNACTLRLILDHYPLASIRDIPEDERWEGRAWRIAGRERTLAQIENEELRARFVEPRVHFAINCASVGCPPLRFEAYRGATIEEQLERQAQDVHAADRWLVWVPDRDLVRLTRIYDWYAGDFERVAGSALAFAARYAPPLAQALAEEREIEVAYLDYDWRLNTVRNAPEDAGAKSER